MALLLLLLSLVKLFLPSLWVLKLSHVIFVWFRCIFLTLRSMKLAPWKDLNWLIWVFPCPSCMIKWLHPVLLHAVCSECLVSCKFPLTITRFQDGVASARLLTHSSHNQITLSGILHLASLSSPPSTVCLLGFWPLLCSDKPLHALI